VYNIILLLFLCPLGAPERSDKVLPGVGAGDGVFGLSIWSNIFDGYI